MLDELTDDQLRDKALDVLTERLGPTQTFRFLSWLRSKPRDYQTRPGARPIFGASAWTTSSPRCASWKPVSESLHRFIQTMVRAMVESRFVSGDLE